MQTVLCRSTGKHAVPAAVFPARAGHSEGYRAQRVSPQSLRGERGAAQAKIDSLGKSSVGQTGRIAQRPHLVGLEPLLKVSNRNGKDQVLDLAGRVLAAVARDKGRQMLAQARPRQKRITRHSDPRAWGKSTHSRVAGPQGQRGRVRRMGPRCAVVGTSASGAGT